MCKLLGTAPTPSGKAEDRQGFKDTHGVHRPALRRLRGGADAWRTPWPSPTPSACPVIVRPAYTLGGTGGGIAYDVFVLREICDRGLELSRVHEVLIERCIAGWKEIEFEVMRDSAGNVITICGMENIDPVGVHTGDSIVVAPCDPGQ